MNSRPKISVIIPVYNVVEYLPQCLDSIVAQDFDDMEVVVVDDGSTDGSSEILHDYCRRNDYFKIVSKVNGGLSDARNVGTAVAQGDYIYYLDSDDWVSPDAIDKLYQFAVENRCDVVQGGFYYAYDDSLMFDDRWIKEAMDPFVLDRDSAMYELIKNHYVKNFAWGKLYRSDIVKKIPFPKGKYFEDAYWQHLIMHEVRRYGVMPGPLYYYRQRQGGISGAFSTRNLDLLKGYKLRLEFVKHEYPQYAGDMLKLYHGLCISMMGAAYRTRNTELVQVYTDFLNRENISYSHVSYIIKDYVKRAWEYFFGKRLKRIEYERSL